MNSSNYNDNSIISLKEDNYNSQYITETKKNMRKQKRDIPSFFSKIFNSVSKIGQGLKNIMSIKINIEDNDNNNNQNIYDQISNRFNTNEEINLIDAPSFMEDSYSFSKHIKSFSNKIKIDNDNKESKMSISHDESKINNYDINSFNKDILNKNEEIINTNILKEDKKNNIKSVLLKKKREREQSIVFKEEEKNNNKDFDDNDDEETTKKEIKIPQIIQKRIEKQNSIQSNSYNNRNNVSEQKNRINTSLVSLSMKSLDNIKEEINQRREENIRNIEVMYKRNGLYYDYEKEKEMREKMLEKYYKEKAEKIAEGKIKMEREKLKREEEFKKLKIRKETGLKFVPLHKKPKILKETKSTEIHFSGKPVNHTLNISENNKNNLNVTFGAGNNSSGEQNNQNTENKSHNNDSNTKVNIDLNNKNPSKSFLDSNNISLFGENKFNEKEITIKINDNKQTSINLNGENKKNNNDINNNEIKEINKSENTPSFNDSTVLNFGTSTIASGNNQPLFQSLITNNNNIVNKPEEKQTLNEKANESNNMQSLFTNTDNNEKPKGIFSTNNKDNHESIFFEDNKNSVKVNNEDKKKGESIFGQIKEEGGLFNRNTNISSSINNNDLFVSNKPEEKSEKQSLFNNNVFLKTSSNMNNNEIKDNNQNKPQNFSLFGNKNSLFKTEEKSEKSLFNDSNPFIASSNLNNGINNSNQNKTNNFSLFGNTGLFSNASNNGKGLFG